MIVRRRRRATKYRRLRAELTRRLGAKFGGAGRKLPREDAAAIIQAELERWLEEVVQYRATASVVRVGDRLEVRVALRTHFKINRRKSLVFS